MRRLTGSAIALTLLGAAFPAGLAGAEGGSLFDVNLGLSLWTVVIFLSLLAVLRKFAWGPILAAAGEREASIQRSLDEAAARHAEALRLLEEHKLQMMDARRQVQDIIAEGKAAGERVRLELEEKARAEGQRMLERARAEIERERDAAVADLRRESVDLALAAAGRLLSQKLDGEADRELVLGYVSDLNRRAEREGAQA